MQHTSLNITDAPTPNRDRFNDPIIERADVMWAARRFILLFGPDAPEYARREVDRLDLAGKLQVAEMFTRVHEECLTLLKCSAKYRIRDFH